MKKRKKIKENKRKSFFSTFLWFVFFTNETFESKNLPRFFHFFRKLFFLNKGCFSNKNFWKKKQKFLFPKFAKRKRYFFSTQNIKEFFHITLTNKAIQFQISQHFTDWHFFDIFFARVWAALPAKQAAKKGQKNIVPDSKMLWKKYPLYILKNKECFFNFC